jgi:hypothetical protein
MNTPVIVHQHQFSSLEDFIENNNNFYAHMSVDSACSRIDGEVNDWPCYDRFVQLAPDLAAELREGMTRENYGRATRGGEDWEKVFPWDKLWEAYKIMSELVYVGDPYVRGKDHLNFLTG